MCRFATIRFCAALAAALTLGGLASAQQAVKTPLPVEWRRVGNSALDLGLPSVATGPLQRVWYSADGGRLLVWTASGRIFETSDFEQWREAAGASVPLDVNAASSSLPENGAKVRAQPLLAGRLYGFGREAYRSDDGGVSWTGLTQSRSGSILGGPVTDMAVSPREPDEVTVANAFGVWRSMDAGLSWTGLNESLPNLPVRRLLAAPEGSRGVLAWTGIGAAAIEWVPGAKLGWRLASEPVSLQKDLALRESLSKTLAAKVTAAGAAGDYVYAGAADGRLWASSDQGRTWRPFGAAGEEGAVEAIFVDAQNPRLALAAIDMRPSAASPAGKSPHVRRTTNAGIFWDDLTANLPDTAAHGVAADTASGAVYVATGAGLFFTTADLTGAGPATAWLPLAGLPQGKVFDVRLDPGNNQIWAAVEGYGVYSALAPHRFADPRLVNAADYSRRAAAPGSLLSLLGAKIDSAKAGAAPAPVLDASDSGSQIQVPFEASGETLTLNFAAGSRQMTRSIPLAPVSPVIFVDPDGAPLLLDADTGILIDSGRPAHSGSHVQILATGLGRITPDWPAGLPAPMQDPPKVIADVAAYLDRQPVPVVQAALAPGYVGFYLVEVELPKIVNFGPAELYIEAGGQISNPVRISIEP